MQVNDPKRKVFLVLSSGGARGMAHIGVIEALEEMGFDISFVAGTSIGAMVGGMYASGHLSAYRDWMCNLDKMDVFRLLDFTFSRQGLIKGERVFRELKKIIPDSLIESYAIPFRAVAVDVNKRSEVIFDSGSLYGAMRASVAIPSILWPLEQNGQVLVDGGVYNPLPMNVLPEKNETLVVAVDLNSESTGISLFPSTHPMDEPQSGYSAMLENFYKKFNRKHASVKEAERRLSFFHLMINSLEIMQERLTTLTLEKYPPDYLIRIPREICSTFEFYRAKELIDLGKRTAYECIPADL